MNIEPFYISILNIMIHNIQYRNIRRFNSLISTQKGMEIQEENTCMMCIEINRKKTKYRTRNLFFANLACFGWFSSFYVVDGLLGKECSRTKTTSSRRCRWFAKSDFFFKHDGVLLLTSASSLLNLSIRKTTRIVKISNLTSWVLNT